MDRIADSDHTAAGKLQEQLDAVEHEREVVQLKLSGLQQSVRLWAVFGVVFIIHAVMAITAMTVNRAYDEGFAAGHAQLDGQMQQAYEDCTLILPETTVVYEDRTPSLADAYGSTGGSVTIIGGEPTDFVYYDIGDHALRVSKNEKAYQIINGGESPTWDGSIATPFHGLLPDFASLYVNVSDSLASLPSF